MPPKKIPGQGTLEGTKPERDLGSLNAFARAATPEYWDLDPFDYRDISIHMANAAHPDRLRRDLIDVRTHAPFSAVYEDDNGTHHNVPLNPQEYALIPRTRSIQRYGEVIIAQTMASKRALVRPRAKLREEAEQHALDAIAHKAEAVGEYLGSTLLPQADLLATIQEAVSHPGFWRKKEGDMRIALEQVRGILIPNALQVIGTQRGWTDKQAETAARSVDYRLFFDRAHNRHIGNWALMLALLQDYQQERINLFGDRQGRMRGYLQQHGQSTQQPA